MPERDGSYVVVPRDLLEALAQRLYTAGDDMHRGQVERLLEARGREDKPCWRCGEVTRYDGWDHVHVNGLGIGSCLNGPDESARSSSSTAPDEQPPTPAPGRTP